MSDRSLTIVRRSLGRLYPSDIEDQVRSLSRRIDDMMASSVDLATYSDMDLSGQISELNARLVNDVVLPSDDLNDDEARNRLSAIAGEASGLEGTFESNGVKIGAGAGQMTADVLSAKQAEDLSGQMDKAFNIYAGLADRLGLASPMITSAIVLPGTGAKISSMLTTLQTRLTDIASKLDAMHGYVDQLDTASGNPAAGTGAVTFDRATATEMQRFIAAVLQADEAMKRIEAIVLRKPVEPTPAAKAPGRPGVPLAIVAVAGLVLIGLAFWTIADTGKKK